MEVVKDWDLAERSLEGMCKTIKSSIKRDKKLVEDKELAEKYIEDVHNMLKSSIEREYHTQVVASGGYAIKSMLSHCPALSNVRFAFDITLHVKCADSVRTFEEIKEYAMGILTKLREEYTQNTSLCSDNNSLVYFCNIGSILTTVTIADTYCDVGNSSEYEWVLANSIDALIQGDNTVRRRSVLDVSTLSMYYYMSTNFEKVLNVSKLREYFKTVGVTDDKLYWILDEYLSNEKAKKMLSSIDEDIHFEGKVDLVNSVRKAEMFMYTILNKLEGL